MKACIEYNKKTLFARNIFYFTKYKKHYYKHVKCKAMALNFNNIKILGFTWLPNNKSNQYDWQLL